MPDPPKPPRLPIVTVGAEAQLPPGLQTALDNLSRTVDDRLRVFHEELALTRSSLPPPVEPPPPPSLARSAVKVTGKAAQYIGLAATLAAIASELVARSKPGLVGPLQALADFLQGLAN
jgi:hypothetical protein